MKKKSKNETSIAQNEIKIEDNVFKKTYIEQAENDTNMLMIVGGKKKKNHEIETNNEPGKKTEKKKLSNKERKRLEKVVERKTKSFKRNDLLSKLASVQIKTDELKLYKSVKDIGKKEKRVRGNEIDLDANILQANGDSVVSSDNIIQVVVNSISGSNKKRKKGNDESENEKSDSSTDVDEISTDSEIDEKEINRALEQFKKNQSDQQAKQLKKKLDEYKTAKIESDEENQLVETESKSKRKTKYVHVNRREEIKKVRSKLPIITEEQVIMEKIQENDIVIICGETGSGKTTQVPQFLYEAGYAEDGQMIGITEPRRVAAISMSNRVNDEMNFDQKDSIVSYQIRYEGNWSPNTKLKFMTDGVLLKEIQVDFMLSKYSAIIIDEAHERSVYTDILIGLLSRIVPLRNKKGKPLKLIIMSATLRVEDFTENRRLFKEIPPSIKVDSRQYPVAMHFNKHTYEDYLAEAFRKVCKIHRKLPEGGILIFVTGQQEVHVLCNKLKKTFPYDPTRVQRSEEEDKTKTGEKDDYLNEEDVNENVKKKTKKSRKLLDTVATPNLKDAPKVNLDSYSTLPLDEELDMFDQHKNEEDNDDAVEFDHNGDGGDLSSDDDDEEESKNPLKTHSNDSNKEKPLYILPLYSLLSSEKQARVFEKIPDNCRLCVVATNVAETSLTIPNIKYVVDTGKIKIKFYDKVTGVSTFKICWTSKASADQRAGRAGRTSPGHCYRLYSSAMFNDEFPKFSEPEIRRKPVEDLILQMKDLGIDRIANFPFPTPPEPVAVMAAENLLIQLGALEQDKAKIKNMKDEQITTITSLGKLMASFPINPRYSKMLALASQQEEKNNIVSYILCLISGLSVSELFIDGDTTVSINPTLEASLKHQKNDEIPKQPHVLKLKYSQIRQSWLKGMPGSHSMLLGDLMLLLVALGAIEYEQHKSVGDYKATYLKFCEQYGIRHKAIIEARKLRKQLVNTINLIFPGLNISIDPLMPPPSQEQAKLLRQIVLSGLVDKIAKRYDYAINGKDGKEIKNAYQSIILEDPIFIHPSSVLFKELPEYVCYVEMAETTKMYMKGLCAIESTWLPVYLPSQCKFEKPIIAETDDNYEIQKPRFDETRGVVVCHREASFGKVMWQVKAVEVEFPTSLDLYKWFARFLLQGEVLESMKKYEPVLLASPSTMLKSWAKLQPRTEKFLNALISNECFTRKKLLDIWSTKKDFLLNEYLLWIPESLHFELSIKWPPIIKKQIKN